MDNTYLINGFTGRIIHMETLELQAIPLFKSLPAEELTSLMAVVETRDYTARQVVFYEGQPNDCFMVILTGRVEIVKAMDTEEERQLAEMGEGDFLGEIGLFMADQVRTASVRCLDAVEMLEVPRMAFQELLERQPGLAFHIMQEMSKRLRNSDESMIRDLRVKNKELLHAYEELKAAQEQLLAKERLEAELVTARKIQQNLLPRRMPEPDGWQLAALWQPARQVSGDFYDAFQFQDGNLLIIAGDVSGKGMPASLMMANTRSVLRAAAQSLWIAGLFSPGKLLAEANGLLLPDMPAMMFVTCLAALLDPVAGSLVFANAGHCLPWHFSQGAWVELSAAGMPLGLMEAMTYHEVKTELLPGDSLFLYSDGLLEAHNPAGEMFGKGRIREKLEWTSQQNSLDGAMLITNLQNAVADFSGPGWEQEDDITFVVVNRIMALAITPG
jgi:serine phosphatase RsbU (regulator of sigma subunit)